VAIAAVAASTATTAATGPIIVLLRISNLLWTVAGGADAPADGFTSATARGGGL